MWISPFLFLLHDNFSLSDKLLQGFKVNSCISKMNQTSISNHCGHRKLKNASPSAYGGFHKKASPQSCFGIIKV